MARVRLTLDLDSKFSEGDVSRRFRTTTARQQARRIAGLFNSAVGGNEDLSFTVDQYPDLASVTLVVDASAAVATTDILTVGGVAIASVAATPDPDEWLIYTAGATDALDDAGTAANIAAAIEASTAGDYVTVSVSGNRITLTAREDGAAGNLIAASAAGNGIQFGTTRTATVDASALQDGTTTVVINGTTLTAEAEPAYASGTITCTFGAAVAATDEVSIDGTSFASVAANPVVTDGEWLIGASDSAMATNIAAAINGIVPAVPFTAVANSGVVTITADTIGTAGNVTFTETGSGMVLTGSGNLAGGVNALDAGEFAIVLSGATDADDDGSSAASLKTAIEASAIATHVTVTRAANVLTITSNAGFPFRVTETGNGVTLSTAPAALSGGANGTSTTYIL